MFGGGVCGVLKCSATRELERTTTERMRSTWDTEGFCATSDGPRTVRQCACVSVRTRALCLLYNSSCSSSRTSRRRAVSEMGERERGDQEREGMTEWRAWSVDRRRRSVYWFLWVRAAVDRRSVVVRNALRRGVRSCRPQWFVAAVEFTCGTARRCVRAWPAFYSFVFGGGGVAAAEGRRRLQQWWYGVVGWRDRWWWEGNVGGRAAEVRAREASTAPVQRRLRRCDVFFRRASLIYLFFLLLIHCKTSHRLLVIFDRSARFWSLCTVSHHNTIRRTVSSPPVHTKITLDDFLELLKLPQNNSYSCPFFHRLLLMYVLVYFS